MAGVMDTLISGIIKSAMSEILKKTGVKATTTKRTKRKTRSTSNSPSTTSSRARKRKPAAGGGGSSGAGIGRAPATKQVSKRRTNSARSKARRRS